MKILLTTNTFGSYKRQDIAIQSYKKLLEEFPDILSFFDIQFRDEKETFNNVYGLDVTFSLKRSSLDIIDDAEKKLPLVNDLFCVAADLAEDYFIFTNSDVIINKNLIEYIIKNKPECFACSRLDIEDNFTDLSELKEKIKPVRWEIAGFDTFIFRKEWFLKYKHLFNDYFLGKPEFDHVYAAIMKCFGDNTPFGNHYPPFCFHIHHGMNSVLIDSPESRFNRKTMNSNPLDKIMTCLMFFHLKQNLCRRTPWGAFIHPKEDEKALEKMLFDTFNVHIENRL